MSEDSVRLPNGSEFLLRMAYTSREQSGVTVRVYPRNLEKKTLLKVSPSSAGSRGGFMYISNCCSRTATSHLGACALVSLMSVD